MRHCNTEFGFGLVTGDGKAANKVIFTRCGSVSGPRKIRKISFDLRDWDW